MSRSPLQRLRHLGRDLLDRGGWTTWRDSALLRRAITPASADHDVLIAPPGSGNLGDQAMVEAFLAAVPTPVTVVVRRSTDVVIPEEMADRARMLVLPSLMYGGGARHRADVAAFGRELSSARSLSIIGADTMDGVYSLRSSLRRSAFARAAAQRGLLSSVLGFSWSPRAVPAATAGLRNAARQGVRLLVRDPESAARLRARGIHVTDTADLVFGDDRIDPTTQILPDGSPFAILNTSGLIARRVDQIPAFAELIAHLAERGVRSVLLPHVLRSSSSDLVPARLVHAKAPDAILVDHPLTPAQVRGLAQRAAVVVTGRMHLAVIALSQGTPAVTLSTHGKVEGLMRLFDLPEFAVDPSVGMGPTVRARVDDALDDASVRARISERQAFVRALAHQNVAALLDAPTPETAP